MENQTQTPPQQNTAASQSQPAPMGQPTNRPSVAAVNRTFSSTARFIATVPIIIGLIAGGIAYFMYSTTNIPASYLRTTGTVIAEVRSYTTQQANGGDSARTTEYAPEIQYKVGKITYIFTDEVTSSSPSFDDGQSVSIAYNPQNPGKSPKNASDKSMKTISIVVGTVGLIAILIGLFRLLSIRSIPPSTPTIQSIATR
jgi:hypothetical protein